MTTIKMTTVRQSIRILALMVTGLHLIPMPASALESTGAIAQIDTTVVDSISAPKILVKSVPLGTTDNQGYALADVIITSQDDATSSFKINPNSEHWEGKKLVLKRTDGDQIATITTDIVLGSCKEGSVFMLSDNGYRVANPSGFENDEFCGLKVVTNNASVLTPGIYSATMVVTALTD